ncbi:MAG: sulfatase-like hydrolase/transferase, partial [Acidobacteria bacterium]|nr:sulfatase-like hydrolase/transferase [Acidobacteriota bacterium]
MAKPTRSGQSIRTRTLNRRAVFSTGMLFCLCLGFLDLLRSLVSAPHGLSSFPLVLELLAAGILTFLFLYLITWLLIGSSLELLLRLDPLPRAVSVGVFLSAATAVVSLPGIDFSQWSASIFVVAVFLGFCLVASGGAYYLTQAAETKPHSRGVATVIALAGPIVLAETLLFVWFEVFEIFGSASYAVLFCRLAYLAAVGGTLWVAVRFRQRVSAVKVPPYAVLVFLLIPIGIRIFSGLGGFAGVHVAPQERTSERKRVFLITIDTLRADALSCYNRRTASTPHIARLAADGIVFENAVSPASWTLPAMASLMTGLPPSVHRTVGRTARLPGKLMTLAEVMREAGYRTTGVGLSTYLGRPFNILQGFDEYAVFPRSVGNSLGASVLKSLAAERFARLISTSELTDVACRRVAAIREEDVFFWVHYFDPHDPYTPPADYLPRQNPPRSIGNEFSKIEEIRSGHFVPNRQERSWIGEL